MKTLAAGALLAALAVPAMAAPSLVGNWFGTGQPDDRSSMFLDHFRADGSFHSDFRTCVKGKPLDSREDGTWRVDGNSLTITVLTHDGLFAPRNDVYRIVSLGPQAYKDIYLGLNFPYDNRRVDAKFTVPPCDLVS